VQQIIYKYFAEDINFTDLTHCYRHELAASFSLALSLCPFLYVWEGGGKGENLSLMAAASPEISINLQGQ
jgi:hypothetical protein